MRTDHLQVKTKHKYTNIKVKRTAGRAGKKKLYQDIDLDTAGKENSLIYLLSSALSIFLK